MTIGICPFIICPASVNNFFNQVLLHHLLEFHQTSQELYLGVPLSKLLKYFHSMQKSGWYGNQKEKLKKILGSPLLKKFDLLKNMAAKGQSQLFLCI